MYALVSMQHVEGGKFVRLFNTEQEAIDAGIAWMIAHRKDAWDEHLADGEYEGDEHAFSEIEESLDFAEWCYVEEVTDCLVGGAVRALSAAQHELKLWHWLTENLCTLQPSTVAPTWHVFDVKGERLGKGDTPQNAIEQAQHNLTIRELETGPEPIDQYGITPGM